MRLRSLILGEDRVLLSGIVYQEILSGLRSDRQRAELVATLAPFPFLRPTRETHERAARLRDRCFAEGVSVGTVDVLIAQTAIDNDCLLLTSDADFAAIAARSELRLLG